MALSQGFLSALAFTLQWEGGYVNNPNDPGGATNKGITQNTYDGWRTSQGLAHQSVNLISDSEVQTIYYNNFWKKAGCDNYSDSVGAAVFDFVVNSGFASSSGYGGMQIIQRSFNLTADGIVGPKTIAAISGTDEQTALQNIQGARKANYERLAQNPKLQVFEKGWLNRLASLNEKLDINLA